MNITFGWFMDLLIILVLLASGIGIFHLIRGILLIFMRRLR